MNWINDSIFKITSKDKRTIGSGVSTDINTFKNVLVSGRARQQGPWGQMVLEKILEIME